MNECIQYNISLLIDLLVGKKKRKATNIKANYNVVLILYKCSVTNWLFLYWPWHRFELSSIGPRANTETTSS